ncbi:MAG: tRNA lysidine(34) synthetase TilS [candidate division Zixibacteria bacterium]|nr:tRNA lysidine(34) synthetase TilS [candidate division Zixibacteria bacterium]
MDEFVSKAQDYIKLKKLIKRGDGILLACSGGPDSMALLRILTNLQEQWDLKLGIAHLNHEIRKQAVGDCVFVRKAAIREKLPFYSKSLDIPVLAKDEGISIEESARNHRYDFLEATAKDRGYNKIAFGHNFDDNIETIIFNIMRGCGLKGLSGIPAVRDKIIRPLLGFKKAEILSWIAVNDIEYVVDHSNEEVEYTRNRIRNRLLPYIRKNFNKDIENSINRLSLISCELNEFIYDETLKKIQKLTTHRDKSKIILDLRKFSKYHVALKRSVIREIVKSFSGLDHPPNFIEVDQFINFCKISKTGKRIFPGGIVAELIGEKLVIGKSRKYKINKKITFPGIFADRKLGFTITGEILNSVPSIGDCRTYGRDVAYFDLGKLSPPHSIRNVKAGDKMKPLGMSGHKNVMDILSENGIPSFLKDSHLAITSGDEIAWLVGIRLSEDFKIDSNTRTVLRLEYEKRNIN